MIDKALLVLVGIGYGIKFNLIGEISISELFLIATSFFYIKKIKFSSNREIRQLTILYILLILVQIITELVVGNAFKNAGRGIAVNVMSYLYIIFLYTYFKRDRSLISFALLGIILRFIIFGRDLETINIEDNAFIGFLKFTLYPILLYSFIYLSTVKRQWKIEYLAMFSGILLVILGARGGGGIIFVTGFLMYIKNVAHKIRFVNIKFLMVIASLLIYTSYCFYVNQVLNGKIQSGNSKQLERTDYPYNPINLLMVGRSEVFTGYIAFTDKPLTGWGAWCKDPGMKYHKLQATISNGDYNIAKILTNEIPAHSVLIGTGVNNGIFAFCIMIFIYFRIIQRAKKIFMINDAYTYVIIAFTIDFIWTMLFAPQSVFRYLIPIEIAFILISYQRHFVYKRELGNLKNKFRYHK